MINTIDAVYQPSTFDRVVAFVSTSSEADGCQLYYASATGTGAWAWGGSLGPPPGTPADYPFAYPSAVYQAATDQVMAFVTGSDGMVYRAFLSGSALAWDTGPLNPSGPVIGGTTDIALVDAIYVPGPDHVMVFGVGSDGYLYLNWDYSPSNWFSIGRPTSGKSIQQSLPVAIYEALSEVVWVFIQSDDGRLWYATAPVGSATTGIAAWTWGDVGPPPATIVGLPAVTYQSSLGPVLIFVQCVDGHLYRNSTANLFGGWPGGWVDHGAPFSGSVPGGGLAAVSTLTNHVHVFAAYQNGPLFDHYGKPDDQYTWDPHSPPPGNPQLAPDVLAAAYQPSIDRAMGFVTSWDTVATSPVLGSLYVIYTVLRWRWDDVGSP